jgi:hypothetical protein
MGTITLPDNFSGSSIESASLTAYDNVVANDTQVNAIYAPYEKISQSMSSTAPVDVKKRQYEINEWTVSNKRDTLFVLQLLFVALCLGGVLTGLYKGSMIGGGLYGMLSTIIIIIVVFTIVRRTQYTNFTRDNRYWNRMRFDKAPTNVKDIQINICSGR